MAVPLTSMHTSRSWLKHIGEVLYGRCLQGKLKNAFRTWCCNVEVYKYGVNTQDSLEDEMSAEDCGRTIISGSLDKHKCAWATGYARRKGLSAAMSHWINNCLVESRYSANRARNWRARKLTWHAFCQLHTQVSSQKIKIQIAEQVNRQLILKRAFACWLQMLIRLNTICKLDLNNRQNLLKNNTDQILDAVSNLRATKIAKRLVGQWEKSLQTSQILRCSFDMWVACMGCSRQVLIDRFILKHLKTSIAHSFVVWRDATHMRSRQTTIVETQRDKHFSQLLRKSIALWQLYSQYKSDLLVVFCRASDQHSRRVLTRFTHRWSSASKMSSRERVIFKMSSKIYSKSLGQKAYGRWKILTVSHLQHADAANHFEMRNKSRFVRGWIEYSKRKQILRKCQEENNLRAQQFWMNQIFRAWLDVHCRNVQQDSQLAEEYQAVLLKKKHLVRIILAAKKGKKTDKEGSLSLLSACMNNWTQRTRRLKIAATKLQHVLVCHMQMVQRKALWGWKSEVEHASQVRAQKLFCAKRAIEKKRTENTWRVFFGKVKNEMRRNRSQDDENLLLMYWVLTSWRSVAYCAFHENSRGLLLSVQQTFLSQPSSAASSVRQGCSPVSAGHSPQNTRIPLPPRTRQSKIPGSSCSISSNRNPPQS